MIPWHIDSHLLLTPLCVVRVVQLHWDGLAMHKGPPEVLSCTRWLGRAVRVQAEVDTESIGTVLCRKAESLDAVAIIVSCEARSRLQEFFLGSITNFCTCAPCPFLCTQMYVSV